MAFLYKIIKYLKNICCRRESEGSLNKNDECQAFGGNLNIPITYGDCETLVKRGCFCNIG